jgi:hypothetical protein
MKKNAVVAAVVVALSLVVGSSARPGQPVKAIVMNR